MGSALRAAVAFCLLLAGLLLCAGPARACNVPVFRYALERWPAAPYEVFVFHRGPLSAEDQAALEHLKELGRADSGEGCINLCVADLDGTPNAYARKIWDARFGPSLPWMVVRYPDFLEVPEDLWSGPLTKETATALLDSPARRRIARSLIEGQSAVFVLLESGVREKDDAAAALLEKELKRLEQALKLPEIPAGQWGDPAYDAGGAPALRVAFSVLRFSRSDPAEQVLAKMLLGPGPLPPKAEGPATFPIFGRGRALCAIAEEDLSADRIEAECEFLIGPCSCIVKNQNPGMDMLMAVDWDAALSGQPSAIPVVDLPPVAGLAAFAANPKTPSEPAISWSTEALVRRTVAALIVGFAVLTVIILAWRKKHPKNN